MEIPTYEYLMSLKPGQLTGNFIKKKFPDFFNWINSQYSQESLSFSEKLYWYYHDLTSHPKCKYENCNNNVKYHSFNVGYKHFCSVRCSTLSKETQSKIKETCLKKYGVEHSSRCPNVINKMKKTNIEKYGCECSLHNIDITKKKKRTWEEKYGYDHPSKSDIIKEKIKMSNLEKYGVVSTLQLDEIKEKSLKTKLNKYGDGHFTNREKASQTNLKKYGSKTIFGSPEKQKEVHDTKLQNFLKEHGDYLLDINNINGVVEYACKCPHKNCTKCLEKKFNINAQHYTVRRYNNVELCTKLNPVSKDNIEGTYLEIFVRNILDDLNIKYISNDRTVLNGKELDIYIPDKKIAVECNGIYWHSADMMGYQKSSKHFNKWKECLENGIQLLTFWEDQIVKKPEIVKSIILSKLGFFNKRIYARNCDVKLVSTKESVDFLNTNHLQGNVHSSVKIGLYYNNELISIMTFGKIRKIFNKKNINGFELYRFCNKIGYQIIGGASKLFKHFINQYNPIYIESFSSNDISNGNIYKRLGFDICKTGFGSYWYIDKKLNRYHRYKFRKSELKKLGIDDKLSESKIMENLSYFKIYDSGQTKYIWNDKKGV